jgi:hypothetical protein
MINRLPLRSISRGFPVLRISSSSWSRLFCNLLEVTLFIAGQESREFWGREIFDIIAITVMLDKFPDDARFC